MSELSENYLTMSDYYTTSYTSCGNIITGIGISNNSENKKMKQKKQKRFEIVFEEITKNKITCSCMAESKEDALKQIEEGRVSKNCETLEYEVKLVE